jgi:hypothetical protein
VDYKLSDAVKILAELPGDGIAVVTAGTVVDLYADGEVDLEVANSHCHKI